VEWILTEVALEALLRDAHQLHRLGRVPEAIEAYTRILALRADLAECWFNLGVLLRQQRQFTEALSAYQRALDNGISGPEEVYLNRGVIYADFLRQDAAAEQELKRALQLNPNYIPALLNLANLQEDLGNRSEAGGLYERILTLDASCLEALARYANLQPAASADDRVIAQLQGAFRAPASAAERASILFALGRLLDGKQQFAAAFEAYTAANANSRASAAPGHGIYDRKRQEELVDQLISACPETRSSGAAPTGEAAVAGESAPTGEAAVAGESAPTGEAAAAGEARPSDRGSRPVRAASRAETGPQPIFICGLFRSGSTLAEQLLAGHPQVVAGGELDILQRLSAAVPSARALAAASPDLLASLANTYRDELRGMFPGASYVTDKRPDNFLHVGLIKRLFPDSRIVHTTRDPLDNCLSIFFLHLDHSMGYALNLLDIGHYFRQYRRLMAHWQRCYGAGLFELHYDSFVRQPAREAARLFNFLGLEWDERYLAVESRREAVKTASVWQVREPIYTRSSGRAAHYATQLRELREYLADLLPK
jgi:tetratricopeptide (TPR) repeat protein